MTYKELVYFTGKCLTLDERPELREEIADRFQQGEIDLEKFVRLCSDHLILPLIFLKFRTHNILDSLPGDLVVHLKSIYDLNFKRNAHILEESLAINSELSRHKVFPVFLKGTGNLLDGIYSDIGERMIGDIDLLVPEKDYLKTAGKIIELDYSADIPEDPDENINELKHYPRLFKSDAVADIEVHRLPVTHEYLRLLNSGMIEKEKKSASMYPSCFVLSDKHKLRLNFIHSRLINRGHASGIISLRDVYDLYCLSQTINIATAFEDFKQKRKAMAYAVICQRILGFPGKFYYKEPFYSKYTCLRLNLTLRYSLFFKLNRILRDIPYRIAIKYPRQMIKAVYDAKMRRSVIRKICSSEYMAAVFDSYRYLFRK